MIITKTPLRVSLFGGGTDYPAYYREHGGEVLGMAIDKHVYISVRKLPPFFEYKHRIVWSEIELVKNFTEIRHPAIREALRLYGPGCGVELHHDSDLPARSGLGSSSSFAVGLLNALLALRGEMVNKLYLAKYAMGLEQTVLRENVGCQDQIFAAYGGFNHITFNTDDTFSVSPVIANNERIRDLHRHMMLFFTGFSRTASEIAGDQIKNIPLVNRQLGLMRGMVREALDILGGSHAPITEIGALLHDSWRLKRELSNRVSSDAIDAIYDAGREAGAIGGKLLGAGGGGFMLLFVPPEKHKAVKERLSGLVNVRFNIANEGSKVAVYEPNGL